MYPISKHMMQNHICFRINFCWVAAAGVGPFPRAKDVGVFEVTTTWHEQRAFGMRASLNRTNRGIRVTSLQNNIMPDAAYSSSTLPFLRGGACKFAQAAERRVGTDASVSGSSSELQAPGA